MVAFKSMTRRRGGLRPRKRFAKFVIPAETKIDYKNLAILQKFVTERGKIISRRISGVTAKQQRDLTRAIKRAQHLGLLPVGGSKRRS